MADPIGIRQNNPGNIRFGAGFDGEEEGDKGFGAYPTPVAGGTALIKNLVAYDVKHGLNTVQGIVGRWAPRNENDTTAYINSVAADLGVGSGDVLNMKDPGTLAKLATAISKHEGNGAVFNGDFYKALTGNNPELAAYIASQKMPSFSKQQARSAAYRANPYSPGEPGMNHNDTAAIDAVWNQPDVIGQAATLQAGREIAAQTRWAGLGESFVDSWVNNTVTGRIIDMTKRGEVDPNFKIEQEQFDQMATAGVLQNKQLSDFVSGAYNAEDFQRRLELAQERNDYFQRASNTAGLASAGATTMQLIGGMADPVAIIATLGAGWAANAARAGAAASVGASAMGGAVGNIAVGEFVNHADNQQFSWGELISQGIQGAALGTLGHLLSHNKAAAGERAPAPGTPVPEIDPVLRPIAAAVQESMQSNLNAAWEAGRRVAANPLAAFSRDGLSAELHDVPTSPAFSLKPKLAGAAVSEEHAALSAGDIGARTGYTPVSTLLDSRYNRLHDQGVIMELRTASDLNAASPFHAKYGEAIPEDAKAFYSPQDDRVYVFRDRLSAAEAADPTGLIMHEVGVHYGLERMVGTENFSKLLKAVDDAQDPRVLEAKTRVPKDTPEHIKLEEALGYLAEKHPQLAVTSRIVSSIRNWLRDNIPAFRRMALTTNDVLQYVRGSVKNARKHGKLSMDSTFPFVWHGSPVRGIEQMDLRFAGTGEGAHAYGFGHYVTSEKGTAIDYRNKEATRRGLAADEGGLYRLRVNTTQDRIMRWDRPLSEQPSIQALLKGHVPFEAGETGQAVYERLSKKLGGQKAASEYLNEAGVHGLRYDSGRSRGTPNPNSNYVLFHDDHLDISNRYSRGAAQVFPSNAARVQLRMSKVASDIADRASKWVEDTSPESKAQRERLEKWYNEQRVNLGADKVATWIDSPGLIVQRDKSKVARYLGAHLFEDATGIGKRESTVAIDYERTQFGYKAMALPSLKENLVKGFTPMEKAQYMMGFAKAAEDRVWRQVAEERLAHRAANEAGVKFESSAPDHIRAMAKTLDDFYDKVTADGRLAGNPYADAVRGGGFVGFMPYAWQWERIADAHSKDAPRFAALHENLTQQYAERIVDPAIDELLKKNPAAAPDEIKNLRDRMNEKVGHLVDTKLNDLMADPQSRINHFDQKFEVIAGDLLKENFDGAVIDANLLQQFKEQLADIRTDRNRTELDLTRKVNNVSLLDFMDHNGERMVTHGSHRFAGLNALARKGFIDEGDATAALEAARKDGASRETLQALDFGFRSFGLGQLRNHERAAFSTLRNFTYAATMGKLGLSVLADAANVIAASGVSGFMRAIGGSFSKNTEFLKQMAVDAPSLLGQDYRLHSLTPDVSATGRVMLGEGSNLNRMSQRATQLVSWLNGSNVVGTMLHRGFLPVFAEDLLRTIKGENGGMSLRRMADVGLDPETMGRIKAQLDQFDKGRERGGRINWDQWEDQAAADKLIEAMHRGTYQTFQRAMVGEAPMWLSESNAGSLFGQFRRYGIVSSEKQLARNVAIGDMNTVNAFVLGTAWAGMLYYARLQLNSMGKTDAQKQKYIEDNTKGFKLAAGVFTLMNMSGVLPDTLNLGELVFGGTAYNQVGSPIAAMGYLGNIGTAMHSAGSLATGQSANKGQDAKNILRIAPLANSIVGTYVANSIAAK
ncbi:putative internal virion protein [Burkholderia phage AMP1]|uniref:Putative internal virion protein n=3 Tax=Ampunavirus BpAMP1 TaxID=2733589 RepID=A0A5C2IBS2_9CAUD|nr:endolysin [Burkholderia phage Bp-AMP1]QEP52865.1 putative internal virion protein [Burkholderia phage AMP1]CDK30109.1 putative transglycosylase [Burkholderia phage Bp-AMP1]CDL65235.1 putative transglycosylase [Burkholderia phage Bp-AMP3]